jgi:hypothetical protein
MVLPSKGVASGHFYRLCQDGVGSTNNWFAFDQTDPNPATKVVADFDFRFGRASDGGTGTPADGIGFALLNTNVSQNGQATGDAGPSITEEASATYSVTLGLDIYANAYTETTSNPVTGGFLNASNNNIKIAYNGVFNDLGTPSHGSGDLPNNHQSGCVYKFSQDIGSNGGGTFTLTRDSTFTKDKYDDMQDWDHCNLTLDLLAQTATVTITPAPSRNQAPFAIFSNLPMPCLSPYPMRVAFGARTGGATDNEDIANVNVVFTP